MDKLPDELVATLRARLPPHAAEALRSRPNSHAALPLHLRKAHSRDANATHVLLKALQRYLRPRPRSQLRSAPTSLLALSLAQVRHGADGVTVTRDAISSALRALWKAEGPPLRYLDLSCCAADVVCPDALAEYSAWLRGLRVLRVAGCPGICDGAFARMVATGDEHASHYSNHGGMSSVQTPLPGSGPAGIYVQLDPTCIHDSDSLTEQASDDVEDMHAVNENCCNAPLSRQPCVSTATSKLSALPVQESLRVLDVSFCRNAWWTDVVFSFPNLDVCIAPGSMLELESRLRRATGNGISPWYFTQESENEAGNISFPSDVGMPGIDDDFHHHPSPPFGEDPGFTSIGQRDEKPLVLNIDLRRAVADDNAEDVRTLFNAIANPVLSTQNGFKARKRPRAPASTVAEVQVSRSDLKECNCNIGSTDPRCALAGLDASTLRLQLLHTYATACPVPLCSASTSLQEEDFIAGLSQDNSSPSSEVPTKQVTASNGLLSLAAMHGSAHVARMLVQDANYCAFLPRSFPPFAEAMLLSDSELPSNESFLQSSDSHTDFRRRASREELFDALLPCAPYSMATPVMEALVVLAAARCDYAALEALLPSTGCVPSQSSRGHVAEREQKAFARAFSALFLPPSGVAFPESAEEDNAIFRSQTGACESSNSWHRLVLVGKRPSDGHAIFAVGRCIQALIKAGARLLFAPYVLHTAAYLGNTNALHVMLTSQEFYTSPRPLTDDETSPGMDSDSILAQKLLCRNENRETVLEAAARGELPDDAKDTVCLILDLMSAISLRSRLDLATLFDVDAANALVVALGVGNESVASLIFTTRPNCIRMVFEDASGPGCALRSIARRVGRASRYDGDILDIGRALLATAVETVRPHSFSEWAKACCKDDIGRSVLHYAVCASDPTFARMLLHIGVDVDEFDDDGITPLCMAVAERGSRACLELLLLAGANVHVEDARGRTPLHLAAEAKNGMAAALLIHYGSSPVHADHFGVSPIHLDSQLDTRSSAFVVTLPPRSGCDVPSRLMSRDASREIVPCACGSPDGSCAFKDSGHRKKVYSSGNSWRQLPNAKYVTASVLCSASSPDFGRLLIDGSTSDSSVCADDEEESRLSVSDDVVALRPCVDLQERRLDHSLVGRIFSFRRNPSNVKV